MDQRPVGFTPPAAHPIPGPGPSTSRLHVPLRRPYVHKNVCIRAPGPRALAPRAGCGGSGRHDEVGGEAVRMLGSQNNSLTYCAWPAASYVFILVSTRIYFLPNNIEELQIVRVLPDLPSIRAISAHFIMYSQFQEPILGYSHYFDNEIISVHWPFLGSAGKLNVCPGQYMHWWV
ncbi:hypothetical protein E2P61_07870 [Candidatus Bathyarchaeota archaeon]|nr:hypothetical protein E2P61_07870 [Candidatus Bathyarchaeota archaeon]